jgi:hypothetical protein
MNTLYQSFTIKKRVYEYLCWLTKEVFNVSGYTMPSDRLTGTCGIRKGLEGDNFVLIMGHYLGSFQKRVRKLREISFG